MATLVVLGNVAPLPPSPPRVAPRVHLLPGNPPLVLAVEGSRLFAVSYDLFKALSQDDENALQLLLGDDAASSRLQQPASLPAPAALSLNIAQACNLSCSYCYADEGRFGGSSLMMSREVAHAAVRQLLDGKPGPNVSIGFIGGEPFLNRDVLRSTVEYALAQGKARGICVRFSVTTNGTLLKERDIKLLRDHAFAVSVSLDGGAAMNDKVRRMRGGSAFDAALQSLAPLLRDPGATKLAARATVTRRDLRVAERVEALTACGFTEVGVSPVRSSPDPELALHDADWDVFLAEMVRAAEGQRDRVRSGAPPIFSNLATALKQLHAGYCKPLPCGSAANYVSISARGEYFTCHRTVGDGRFALGSLASGLSTPQRESFLRARHVDQQEPCRSCWARYLCGGGCHAEVLSAGRSGCDYIRGWLDYCLRFYDEMLPHATTWLEGGLPA